MSVEEDFFFRGVKAIEAQPFVPRVCQHGPFHPDVLREQPDPCSCPWCGQMVRNPMSEAAA